MEKTGIVYRVRQVKYSRGKDNRTVLTARMEKFQTTIEHNVLSVKRLADKNSSFLIVALFMVLWVEIPLQMNAENVKVELK